MSYNPYESPLTQSSRREFHEGGAGGAWRDGKLLVVSDGYTKFPEYCIKTGEPTGGNTVHITVDWIPNHTAWVIALGAIGHAIAKARYGRKFSLDLPISPDWMGRRRRRAWLGWSTVIGGLSCLILGTVGYVLAMAQGAGDDPAQWIVIVVLLGPLISIFGLVLLLVLHRPIVGVRKVIAERVWLTGASPDFLRRLPECE